MKTTRYRKKPTVIDAWPISDLSLAVEKYPSEVPECITEAIIEGHLAFNGSGVTVTTLEGTMVGGFDSMLIRGVQGEWYPCRNDIFSKTYEPEES